MSPVPRLAFGLMLLVILAGCSGASASFDEAGRATRALAVPTQPSTPATTPVNVDPTDAPNADSSGNNDLVRVPQTTDSSICQSKNAQEDTPVSIGILAPLTESAAQQAGAAMLASAGMAKEDINLSGSVLGKDLYLVKGNTKGDPELAQSVLEQMITEECIVGVVGIYHSPVGLAIKEVAHRYGIPVIFAEPFSDEIMSGRYPEIFRVGPSSHMVNYQFVQWMDHIGDFNGDGAKVVTIIAENGGRSIERIESISSSLGETDFDVKPFLVDLPTPDFSSVIARIVGLENIPDFILVWFNGESGYTLINELRNALFNPESQSIVIARQSMLDHEQYWQKVPEGTEVVVSKIGPWHSTITDVGRSFATRYELAHGHWPESYAFSTYDSVWLMAEAINRANTVESAEVIHALENIDIELASGHYCFTTGENESASCPSIYGPMWHQWPDSPILFLQYTVLNQPSSEMTVLWPPKFRNAHISAK